MAVIGIIMCEILELEFASLLAGDHDVARVTVLEDARSRRLIGALEDRGAADVRCIPHLNAFRPEPGVPLEVVVRVLDFTLHRSKRTLRRAILAAGRDLSRHVDTLLAGYGLCGNAPDGLREMLGGRVPVFAPMDGSGQPVDDCVGLLLGGREAYRDQLLRVPGTFFMTPGWACHWQRMFEGHTGCRACPAFKRLFARYERSLLVLTPVVSEAWMRREAGEFAAQLGLRTETCRGTVDLLAKAWASAKAHLPAADHSATLRGDA